MRTMPNNPDLDEHVLSINDYFEANEVVRKTKDKSRQKLSKKERAILTLAADAVAAHRSVDLYRSLILKRSGVPQMDPDTIDRLKKFRSMIAQGLQVAENGTLVGEVVAVEAILSDFDTVFMGELNR